MPNRTAHALVGLACGGTASLGALNLAGKKPDLGMVALSSVVGLGAGCLPDLLEPALHPGHRSFFHSVVFGLVLATMANGLWKSLTDADERKNNSPLAEGLRLLLLVILVAVVAHLVLDAFTRRSLPIL